MKRRTSSKLEILRLITPVLLALSVFILNGITGDVDKLTTKMDDVQQRLASLEATVKKLQ